MDQHDRCPVCSNIEYVHSTRVCVEAITTLLFRLFRHSKRSIISRSLVLGLIAHRTPAHRFSRCSSRSTATTPIIGRSCRQTGRATNHVDIIITAVVAVVCTILSGTRIKHFRILSPPPRKKIWTSDAGYGTTDYYCEVVTAGWCIRPGRCNLITILLHVNDLRKRQQSGGVRNAIKRARRVKR